MVEHTAPDPVETVIIAVLAELAGLRAHDALLVLNSVKRRLLDRPESEIEFAGIQALPVEELINRHGRRSKIESDPEIRAFIHEIGKHKLSVIAELCRAQLGAARAPSRSAIHRYTQRLRKSRQAFLQALQAFDNLTEKSAHE